MKPTIGKAFHLLVVLYYVYFDKFVFTVLAYDVLETVGEDLKIIVPQFATVWSQFAFQDYFLLSLIEDVLDYTPSSFCIKFKKLLGDHVNNIFICYAWPVSILTSVNFWLLLYIDPGLLDEHNLMFDVFDRATNHVVHTYLIAILLVEMCIKYRRYPSTVTVATPYKDIARVFGVYYTIVFGMKIFSPIWPYPYFKAMSALQWVAYILANLLLAYLCYALGYCCSFLVWGKHPNGTGKGHPKTERTKTLKPLWTKLLRMVQVVETR